MGQNFVSLLKLFLIISLKHVFFLTSGKKHVTPVHQKYDKQMIFTYWPISLLPTLDKVSEKIIFKNLHNHLISNNLITKNQSGFRPGDLVTNQLLSLVNEIQTDFNDPDCLEVRSVYLDMSKAFAKVWLEGFIFKLKQNGVEGKLLALLHNSWLFMIH